MSFGFFFVENTAVSRVMRCLISPHWAVDLIGRSGGYRCMKSVHTLELPEKMDTLLLSALSLIIPNFILSVEDLRKLISDCFFFHMYGSILTVY